MPDDKSRTLTDIVLTIFRLNGSLIAAGDQLTAPMGLTSARWQVLGAIALQGNPVTVPQIADFMGLTRQGAQKQVNALIEDGLVGLVENPRHKRSPLCRLTETGKTTYAALDTLNDDWTARLGLTLGRDELSRALSTLLALETRLSQTNPPSETRP